MITKERQLEVFDETVANAKNGEMFKDRFDTPVSSVLLEDGCGETWGIWGDN